eukprot:COSAG06_NODE_3049_length_5919_cov_3.625773_1_plen_86_part_00
MRTSCGLKLLATEINTPAAAQSAAAGNRMSTDSEVALSMLPTIKWTDAPPDRSCIDELLGNEDIRAAVPDIGTYSSCISPRFALQ